MSFVLVSLIQSDSVQGVRLCGKRLADFLQYMCSHFGGFPAPTWKRAALGGARNQHSVTKLHLLQESLGFPLEKSLRKRQLSTVHQSGIVNECCRKQCTLSTLVSYCAVGANTDKERLAEIESLFSSNSQTSEAEDIGKEIIGMITEQPHAAGNTYISENTAATLSSFPNLGTSNRDRPMFIVLPQLYHEINSDMSSEENSDRSI
ncbi:ilGF domain-containing protein [Trichonephila inaurata madagascariensis]|uniref:IlGF domain-containing protein n=1 Tax=Trichonephila inaurata madagascariensis TaxID=2747483 RepID=A0A8X6MI51_9ARAC|nr:ilGF domain-containing protein [Trichonephila inaurata madagascariensis]GFY70540.1 ilGF domain-containing protein [Trichonephila inaurata madagascariensis]